MRLLPYTDVLDVVAPLYERVARWRVGSISRPAWMWQRILKDASQPTAEPYGKGSFVAVHTDESGTDDGYVFYDVDWDETFAKNPTGTGKVHDLWGGSPDVELELWRYLLDIDLITTWKAEPRPVDEPVRRAMHDSRAYEAVQRFDDQWIRILDVDAALCARTYGPVDCGRDDRRPRSDVPDQHRYLDHLGGRRRAHRPAGGRRGRRRHSLGRLPRGGVVARPRRRSVRSTYRDALLARLDTLFAMRPIPFCGTGY